MSAKYHQNRSL